MNYSKILAIASVFETIYGNDSDKLNVDKFIEKKSKSSKDSEKKEHNKNLKVRNKNKAKKKKRGY